ncbi:MAG: LysR family transcriptional regulator [Alphaproteobacteria bacterium]|nr:LysR family transcriptional regulator [Alphaproteobacteria bacterium]
MEIHQIRYFLALARSLNFTRAAEECCVGQPALTRAIQALEAELGGALICRERRTSHLTDLGQRMLPLLQASYDSAMSAKALARAVAKPDAMPLRLAVSNTVNFSMRIRHWRRNGAPWLVDVQSLSRFRPEGISVHAIAGPVRADFDRLEVWSLWREGFVAMMRADDPLAASARITPCDLGRRALVVQSQCESRVEFDAWLNTHALSPTLHEVSTQAQAAAFVAAGLGLAIQASTSAVQPGLRAVQISGLNAVRDVSAYAIAGRLRPAPANALLALLRAGAVAERDAA